MKAQIEISLAVVIPNYNHAAYLTECLDSVISQSVQPAGVHVIDDASTDDSVDVIRTYVARYPHVYLHQHKQNQGVCAALNGILPELGSTHVLFLAADDYLCPGCIERAHALLSRHPASGVCLADLVEVFPDGTEKTFSYGLSTEPSYFPPDRVPRAVRGLGLVGQYILLLRGLREIGGFPEALRWHTDHFVGWVLATRFGVCYVPRVGSAFRKLPASYSALRANVSAQREVLASFLDYLSRPEFADVRPAAREGHMLAIFGEGLFWALWRDPSQRYFLTPSFLSRLVLRRMRGWIRHPVPPPMKQWFRSRFKQTSGL